MPVSDPQSLYLIASLAVGDRAVKNLAFYGGTGELEIPHYKTCEIADAAEDGQLDEAGTSQQQDETFELVNALCDRLRDNLISAGVSDDRGGTLLQSTLRCVDNLTTNADATRMFVGIKTSLRRKNSGRKIGIQPTAYSRRTYVVATAQAQTAGRKSAATMLQRKGKRKPARKHGISHNIRNNEAPPKKH